jgi:hypothetical protein
MQLTVQKPFFVSIGPFNSGPVGSMSQFRYQNLSPCCDSNPSVTRQVIQTSDTRQLVAKPVSAAVDSNQICQVPDCTDESEFFVSVGGRSVSSVTRSVLIQLGRQLSVC